jgi:hypothetical protein
MRAATKSRFFGWIPAVLAAAAVAATPAAWAVSGPSPPVANDTSLPDARLGVIEGAVRVMPPGADTWKETRTGLPVGERYRISVPEGSEARLRFHGGQYLLISGGSDVTIESLGEGESSFRLDAGRVRMNLTADGFAPVRILAPGDRKIVLSRPGAYSVSGTGEGESYSFARTTPHEAAPPDTGYREEERPGGVGRWWGRDYTPPPLPPTYGYPGWYGGPGWWGGPGPWRGGWYGWHDGRFHGGFGWGWPNGWHGGFGWRR